jgi:hypothetical protein
MEDVFGGGGDGDYDRVGVELRARDVRGRGLEDDSRAALETERNVDATNVAAVPAAATTKRRNKRNKGMQHHQRLFNGR